MEFLSIIGPKDQLDRVTEKYLGKYEIQLENTVGELKNLKNIVPNSESNPYREWIGKAQEAATIVTGPSRGTGQAEKKQTGSGMTPQEAVEIIQRADRLMEESRQQKTKLETELKKKQSLLEAVESLWDMGIVVVVSAGNYGPEAGSVAVPGNSRKVITVGVPDSVRPAVYCRREKMNYSGRGPTKECVIKPDVFAPGTGIISCNSRYKQPGEHLYSIKSGTSMAAPVVSGAAACLLSKYPDMTNVEVKLKLRESCVKYPGTEAGWGLLNVKKLMKA